MEEYLASCSCGFKAKVFYGKSGEKVYEVFSCPKCKNLFSLTIDQKLSCPKCKNEELKRYNPNKKDNLAYYASLSKKGALSSSKLKELKVFWENIKDNECPKCGKKTMNWEVKEKKEKISILKKLGIRK